MDGGLCLLRLRVVVVAVVVLLSVLLLWRGGLRGTLRFRRPRQEKKKNNDNNDNNDTSSSSSKAFFKIDRKSDAEMAGPVHHREKRLPVRQKRSRRRRRRRSFRGEEEEEEEETDGHKNSRLRAGTDRRRFGGFHERVKRD